MGAGTTRLINVSFFLFWLLLFRLNFPGNTIIDNNTTPINVTKHSIIKYKSWTGSEKMKNISAIKCCLFILLAIFLLLFELLLRVLLAMWSKYFRYAWFTFFNSLSFILSSSRIDRLGLCSVQYTSKVLLLTHICKASIVFENPCFRRVCSNGKNKVVDESELHLPCYCSILPYFK